MAKRANSVGNKIKRSHSHKTAKRLEIKRLMLEEKARKFSHHTARRLRLEGKIKNGKQK
jgi:hypothetical protein